MAIRTHLAGMVEDGDPIAKPKAVVEYMKAALRRIHQSPSSGVQEESRHKSRTTAEHSWHVSLGG